MARLGRWVMIGVFVVMNLLIVMLGIGYVSDDSQTHWTYWRIERAAWACLREAPALELMVPAGMRPEDLPELPGCLILRRDHDLHLDVVDYGTPLSRIRITLPTGRSMVLWFPGEALGTYTVEKPRPKKADRDSRVRGTVLTVAGGGAWGCPASGLIRRAAEGERRSVCRFIRPAARIEVLDPPTDGVLFVRVERDGGPPVDVWMLADTVTAY